MTSNYPILSERSLKIAQSIADLIWSTYDDTHGYATEKRKDNAAVDTKTPANMIFFWQQFDSNNQRKFFDIAVLLMARSDDPEMNDIIDVLSWINEWHKETAAVMGEIENENLDESN